MNLSDNEELFRTLLELKQEHRDLDSAIAALETVSLTNQLEVRRLKKKKLLIRDRIREIEDILFPDISA